MLKPTRRLQLHFRYLWTPFNLVPTLKLTLLLKRKHLRRQTRRHHIPARRSPAPSSRPTLPTALTRAGGGCAEQHPGLHARPPGRDDSSPPAVRPRGTGRPRPLAAGRTERRGAAEPRSRSSPRSSRRKRAGRKEEKRGPRGSGGGRLAGSLPPSRPRPAGGDINPSRPPTRARGARPACSAGPRQRKKTRTKRDEEAAATAPAPPRASAAASSFFARLESTPAAGEVTRGAGGSEQGRRARGKRREKRRRKGERERERERSGTGGSPGSAWRGCSPWAAAARTAWCGRPRGRHGGREGRLVGAARERRLSVRGRGRGGRGWARREGKPRTPRGSGDATPARAAAAAL